MANHSANTWVDFCGSINVQFYQWDDSKQLDKFRTSTVTMAQILMELRRN